MSDWTVATDDGLVERLTTCTVCGRQPVRTWGILGLRAVVMSYVLCASCGQPGGMRRVEHVFAQRYEAGTVGVAP